MTRAVAVPVLLVSAFYALVGPSPWLGAAIALLVAASALIKARAEATQLGETLLGLVVAIVSGTTVGSLVPRVPAPGTLKAGWAALAAAALAVVVMRLWLEKPRGGTVVTLAFAMLALAFCGGVQSGLLFPLFAGSFVVSSAWALRRADSARAPLAAWRHYLPAAAVLLAVGGVVGLASAMSLPGLYNWVNSQIMRRQKGRMGFSQRLHLGALEGLLESDRVILRVHGEGVDHLRGIVYSHYYHGRWSEVQADGYDPIELPSERPMNSIEIEFSQSDPDYYFLPLGAQSVALPTGVALANRSSVISPLSSDPSDRLWFHMGKSPWRPPALPDRGDLELSWRVQRVLKPIARDWTKHTKTVEGALFALEARLQKEAKYSLHVEPAPGTEPIVDFVTRGRQGHCEYFASAMAVMARTLGIPTRVVGGYRVTERNPWGGYWLVRERNAHTWVEAWVPGHGWQTFDPTPSDALQSASASTTPAVAGAIDAVASLWSSFVAWLIRRSWFEVVTPLLVLSLMFVATRWWNRRRKQVLFVSAQAMPSFAELCVALERRGLLRHPDEALSAYATRAERQLPGEWAQAVVLAIQRYSAFRYGNIGDRGELDQLLTDLSRRLLKAKFETHPTSN